MNTPALTALVFYVVSKLRCSSVTYTATTLQALYTAMLRVIASCTAQHALVWHLRPAAVCRVVIRRLVHNGMVVIKPKPSVWLELETHTFTVTLLVGLWTHSLPYSRRKSWLVRLDIEVVVLSCLSPSSLYRLCRTRNVNFVIVGPDSRFA